MSIEPIPPAMLSAFAAHLIFAVTSVWLVVIDLKEHRLPNRIVAWASCVILVLLITSSGNAAAAQISEPWAGLIRAIIAGAAYVFVFFLLWFFAPNSLGAGDVKLAPLIGLMAGWSGVWVAALWVPLMIGVIGSVAGVVHRLRGRNHFAFGPVLLGACWLGILLAGVGWIW